MKGNSAGPFLHKNCDPNPIGDMHDTTILDTWIHIFGLELDPPDSHPCVKMW